MYLLYMPPFIFGGVALLLAIVMIKYPVWFSDSIDRLIEHLNAFSWKSKKNKHDKDHVSTLCELLNIEPNHTPVRRRQIVEAYFRKKKLKWKVTSTSPLMYSTETNKVYTIEKLEDGTWRQIPF